MTHIPPKRRRIKLVSVTLRKRMLSNKPLKLGRDERKPVFGGPDKARLEPVSLATGTS